MEKTGLSAGFHYRGRMSSNADKVKADKVKNSPEVPKVVVIKKTRTSLPKLFLRTVYWILILTILAVILYITAETFLTIYKHTAT